MKLNYNYEEFVEHIKKQYPDNFIDTVGNYSKEVSVPPFLEIRWQTGGVSGGSCWDDSNPQSYTLNVSEPELDCLDNILMEFDSDISFLKYKKLLQLVKHEEKTEYEYYGNRTYYKIKKILLSDLYNFLNE